LIEPYSDDPENSGLYLTPLDKIEKICRKAYENKYAVATHCIGDAANRETLKIYGEILGGKNEPQMAHRACPGDSPRRFPLLWRLYYHSICSTDACYF